MRVTPIAARRPSPASVMSSARCRGASRQQKHTHATHAYAIVTLHENIRAAMPLPTSGERRCCPPASGGRDSKDCLPVIHSLPAGVWQRHKITLVLTAAAEGEQSISPHAHNARLLRDAVTPLPRRFAQFMTEAGGGRIEVEYGIQRAVYASS